MVPGCGGKHGPNEGRHVLTIRMRRPDTSAVWAPTTDFHVCDTHATEGADLEIIYRPKKTSKIVMDVYSPAKDGGELHARRQVPIIQGADRAPR
jgi:hypothetical protein